MWSACTHGPPPDPLPGDPDRALTQLASAAWRRDMQRLVRLLTPGCRSGCVGFSPTVLRGISPSGEGYQVVGWSPRLQPGTLIDDLALALRSYGEIRRFELRPLARRRVGRGVAMRAVLSAEGVDQGGMRRTDRGLLDLDLVRRRGIWRFSRVAILRVHTVRRAERGYERTGVAASRRSPRAPAGRHAWWSLGWQPGWSWPMTLGEGSEPATLASWQGQLARDAVSCDVDGDGQRELFVVADRAGGSGLWSRRGGRARRLLAVPGVARAVVCADLDGDARLDLFVVRAGPRDGHRLAGQGDLVYRGDGRGGFVRVATLGAQRGLAACAADFDGDGRLDVLVGNELSPPRLWTAVGERGRLRFRDRATSGGLGRGPVTACAVGDVDGDGRPDLYLGGAGARRAALMLNRSRRGHPPRFVGRGLADLGWSRRAGMLDHDNDGALDLLVERQAPSRWDALRWRRAHAAVARGRRPAPLAGDEGRGRSAFALWINAGRGVLVEGSWPAGLDRARGAALAGDLVGADRALDLATGDGATWRWRGGAGDLGEVGARHGVLLRLRARSPGNRDAIGARVELEADGARAQARWVGLASGIPGGAPGLVHFGVGRAVRVRRVTVRWPDGALQRIEDLPVERLVRINQGRPPSWEDDGADEAGGADTDTDGAPDGDTDGGTDGVADTGAGGSGGAGDDRRAASQPAAAALEAARVALGGRWRRANLLLIVEAGCGAGCAATCRALARWRRRRGLDVGLAVLAVGGRPRPLPGPLARCPLKVAPVTAQDARAVAPALPATVLVDGEGRVRRVDLGPPRPEQLESDLHRLLAGQGGPR